ncbi:hypothetical protein CFC21_063389 [Triticum aestivum]|uniref:Uncharacterized protein n=3 Tax=Triticinae TaxID=1648030 RepID=A0A453J440_AEGTS|nr:uncharacterized protein LOC109756311 [Aegilops tauschii subsp. strangulata]XP_044376982.1 uncharacterized protein LOC123098956 [Triticum aestivum]KAF7055918.1 hypothetical protein CFC21_063389 [Triticum aestivum]
MLPLAAARACLSSPAPPRPRPPSRAAPLSPLPRRRSTATLPRPARLPLLRPLWAAAGAGASSRPARDRVIDFGKHKGQMLGTLPPSYLRWVVAELDYGDTAAWARLAREVLDDPVYVDRVEWEHAHRFLRGDSKFDYVYDDDGDGPLQEMAERFGWDLSDEDGWGRLDFRLLGTSYGGRIPRKADRRQSTGSSGNRPPRGGGALFDAGAADADGPRGKRDERRERMRTRREEQVRTAKLDVLGAKAGGALGTARKARIGAAAKKEILGLGRGGERAAPLKGGEGGNPFPGRQAFLDKVRKLKGDDS